MTPQEAETHVRWLEARASEAPAQLVSCVRRLLESHHEWAALPRAEAFIAASEALLERVLQGEPASRGHALELLAADACVTYAFEAAADEPASIGPRAERAMRRIARVATSGKPSTDSRQP